MFQPIYFLNKLTKSEKMEFIDYFKEIVKRIENEKGACRVKMGEDEFMLHEKCSCDFQDDFVILYDNGCDISIVVRYDAIQTIQYMPQDKLDDLREEIYQQFKIDIKFRPDYEDIKLECREVFSDAEKIDNLNYFLMESFEKTLKGA